MPHSNDYDVIIIGSGAGGGTLAHRLAPLGKRILILERGTFLPRERENWDSLAVFRNKRYLAKETWYDADDKPFQPYTHYWVGGNTKMYGAALLRMRAFDFDAVQHYCGVSPAWPVKYDEFEPYYTQAEHLYSVHGRRGADPFDPPASMPYRHPPLSYEPRMQELADDLTRIGYRPFPVPLGVRLENTRAQAPYIFANFDGFPDPTQIKADAHVVGIASALKYPNVTLLNNCYVEKLETNSTGREVSCVVVRHHDETLRLRGSVVVSACGAINSAALMLRSANSHHPHGLANRSGLVGRNYMTHQNGVLVAVCDRANPSAFQKAFVLTDFYRGADDSKLPLGTIQLMGKIDMDWLRALTAQALPDRAVEDISAHAVEFFLTAEDLPDPENRITLRADGAIKISYRANNQEAYSRLHQKLAKVLNQCGSMRGSDDGPVIVGDRLGISGVSHQNGTMRFGTDPNTSVLNADCRAHDVENLHVVDGSFFPSSSAVNPSLTIMANALRVADHITEKLAVDRGSQPRKAIAEGVDR